VKITVTPVCSHEDGYTDSGQPYKGQHAVISNEGVCLDGEWVIQRDRRMKKNREPGHPWIIGRTEPRTSFRVTVEP
jgi:hypothetical protein